MLSFFAAGGGIGGASSVGGPRGRFSFSEPESPGVGSLLGAANVGDITSVGVSPMDGSRCLAKLDGVSAFAERF